MPDLSEEPNAITDLTIRYGSSMLGWANSKKPEEDTSIADEVSGGTKQGRHHMRGIPCIAPAVGGTQEGTDPLQALLEKAERMGW